MLNMNLQFFGGRGNAANRNSGTGNDDEANRDFGNIITSTELRKRTDKQLAILYESATISKDVELMKSIRIERARRGGDAEKRTWLRSLEDGEVWDSVQDNRTVRFQKMEGNKKYIVTEWGNRYNADGSYTPYRLGATEVGEKALLNYLRDTKSLRKRG